MRKLLAGAFALAIMFPATSFAGGGNDCGKYGGSYDSYGNCNFKPAQPSPPSYNNNNQANSYSNSNANAKSYSSSNVYSNNSNHNSNYNSNSATGGNARAKATGGNASINGAGNVSVYDKTNIPPPAYAPSMATGNVPNGSCRTGVAGSVGAMGVVSLGFGSTELDDECEQRYNIQLVSTFNPALAEEMTNDLKGVKEAKTRLPPEQAPQQVVYVQAPPAQPQYYQQQPTYNPPPMLHNEPTAPPRIVTPTQAEQEPGS